jgi:hypothetical protein
LLLLLVYLVGAVVVGAGAVVSLIGSLAAQKKWE